MYYRKHAMLTLRQGTETPPSSPAKYRRTTSLPAVHSRTIARQFLDKLTTGLHEGVSSYDDIALASEREMYIALNTQIFNELHLLKTLTLHSFAVNDNGLTIQEKEHGVALEMNGITKLLPGETLQSLATRLSADIIKN